MPAVDLQFPHGVTPRGFTGKNIFADLKRLIEDCAVVITAGAHRGDDPLTYRSMFPEASIHCVEPTPAYVNQLQALFASDARITIHPVALSDSNGVKTFRLTPEGCASSLLAVDQRAIESIASEALAPVRTIDVRSETLDDLCANAGVAQVDLLALDVQGAELIVLQGATRLLAQRRIKWIVVEMCFVPVYEGQATVGALALFLERAGFEVRDFYNFAYSEDGQLLWGDAVYRLGAQP
jgi:FkbM family methyltransferase